MSKKNATPVAKAAETATACIEECITYRSPSELKPYPTNARVHDEKQIAAIMSSINEFGFTGVIVTNEENIVLAGHGRLEAAKRLNLPTVPKRVKRAAS